MDTFSLDCAEAFVAKVTEKLATAPRDICQNGQGAYIEQMVTVSQDGDSYIVNRKSQKGQTTYTIHAL